MYLPCFEWSMSFRRNAFVGTFLAWFGVWGLPNSYSAKKLACRMLYAVKTDTAKSVLLKKLRTYFEGLLLCLDINDALLDMQL